MNLMHKKSKTLYLNIHSQDLFSEDNMPKEKIMIERPWKQLQMNVINLLNDFVNIALGHHTFVVNLLDDPNECALHQMVLH